MVQIDNPNGEGTLFPLQRGRKTVNDFLVVYLTLIRSRWSYDNFSLPWGVSFTNEKAQYLLFQEKAQKESCLIVKVVNKVTKHESS